MPPAPTFLAYHATPSTIEPEAALAMARMESRGAMYGQWRQQVVEADRLHRRRQAGP